MTFINILIVAIWTSRPAFRAYGQGNLPLQAAKLPIYLTIMWWERTQFSNSAFWRLVFSHSWFRIHLQLDFVSEPVSKTPKCFGGEPASLSDLSVTLLCGSDNEFTPVNSDQVLSEVDLPPESIK